MVTSKHASWVSDTPYSDQLDRESVGPHAIGVEWDGYNPRPHRSDADVVVTSLSELWTERDNANSGDLIWLDEASGPYLIDDAGYREDIPSGVTIASDGATIYSESGQNGVFELTHDGARLTGIRFEGHQATGTTDDYNQYIGVLCRADVEVDNCEFNQWSLSGIYVGFPSEDTQVVEPHIHHCLVYDNRWDGYGYGVVVYDGGGPRIEYSYFNNNRHGLAGGGNNDSSYRAYNNIHGTEGVIHQFEQHPDPGGDRMDVRHNELRMTEKNGGGTDVRAYSQRGTPATEAAIVDNWIYNPVAPGDQPTTAGDHAIVQYEHGSSEWVNVSFANNHYGSSEPTDSTIGIQSLTDLNEDIESETFTLDVEVTDSAGTPVTSGTVEITRVGDLPDTGPEHTVAASDGPSVIQTTLDGAAIGETVHVSGAGGYTWSESIEVPNGVTLDVSNDVSVTVPADHDVTGYSVGSRTVYSLITHRNRSSPQNVTIRGGSYDLSAMPETGVGYAGIWLHDAEDCTVEDVRIDGAGQAIYGSGSYRSFGIAMTDCTDCDVIDSEAYDSGYDDIGVRGGCTRCRVIRSGGSGGSSGTIQTARWGAWGLTGYPVDTEYIDCWGRRIYDHDGEDTLWDGCASDYRIQTIGTDRPLIRNSTGYEGLVLLYTYDSSSLYNRIENMEFIDAGEQDLAIQIGPNAGNDIGTVDIVDCWARRPTFLHFNDYSTSATIDTVEVTNGEFYGSGSNSEIVSKDSGVEVDTLIFRNCEFDDFDIGIVGDYSTVIVEDCTFHSLSQSEAIDVSASVQRSGNSYQ